VSSTPASTGDTPDIAESFGTGAWKFTPEVVEVFNEHVTASVPFYDAMQDLVAQCSDWLLPAGGLVADLGASTGTTVKRIFDRHPDRRLRAALYDVEQPMLDRAAKELSDCATGGVEYLCHPIQDPPLMHRDADLTISLFTLQFLPLRDRVAALRNARLCATETGALIVAEKVRPVDARWAEIGNDVSHDWKADHGIDAAAIRAKSRALRGVLMPYPEPTLTKAITAAGWTCPEVLFRWHSWVIVGAFATVAGF
jgi:tRNA (cmo5U34)-methyltransferase